MRLITFGDSWTAGHGVEDESKYKRIGTVPGSMEFLEKLRTMNSYPKFLSDKLNCPFVNFGVCGISNEMIYYNVKTIIKSKMIKEDDIIIVMFTYPYRGTKNPIEIFELLEKELNPYKHFYFNGWYNTFKDEKYDIATLPDYFINPNNNFSDWLIDYEIKNNANVWEYGCRSMWDEKLQKWTNDYHPNIDGYKLIANEIYKNIVGRP
jgi:hypothetical protein